MNEPMQTPSWRSELPILVGALVILREPTASDLGYLVDLLSLADATKFGFEPPITEEKARELVERAQGERAAGLALTYLVVSSATRSPVGLFRVRQLDPTFEGAEWECTISPSARGSGVFLESARLVGSFLFDAVGVYRLEARVPLQNGRAHGALRKLGAVQEGILRRSIRHGGEYLDQVLWSILKVDWTEHASAVAPRVH
jgi:N-acetyltransferase